MQAGELDNPFWASLQTRHRRFALGNAGVVRYPADFAPFLGVASADEVADTALDALLAPDETVLLMGVAPRVSSAWSLEPLEMLAQLTCVAPMAVPDGPEIVALGEPDRAAVLALTALVYPHYFRPQTMALGRYFGIYRGGRLAAMIGERLGTASHTEMSAICTHPDFRGLGYARRLTAFLTNDTLAQGRTAFLHASHENPSALALYEGLGYRRRRDIPFWSLRRTRAGPQPGTGA